MATITDQAPQKVWSGEGDLLHQADVTLAISPATIAAAEVRVSDLENGTEVVTIELGGIRMQSFRCDALEVAFAFGQLRSRISREVLDHRQSKTQDPML